MAGANKKNIQAWPSEKASRRGGWTEGPGVRLADGEVWHFPSVDIALLPYLPRLVPITRELAEYLGPIDRGEVANNGVEAKMAAVYFDALLRNLLTIQYRNRNRTLSRLLDPVTIGPVGVAEINGVVDAYMAELVRFVSHRMPIGFEGAGLVVTLN